MMTAGDIMTKKVIVLNEEDEIKKAADIFLKDKINAIPVVNADKKLCGIVSETDLVYQESNLHIPTVLLFSTAYFTSEPQNILKKT